MGFLLTVAIVVGVPALVLGLLRGVSPELAQGSGRFLAHDYPAPGLAGRRTRRALVVLLFAAANGGPREASFLLFLAALILVAFFLWAWQREFLFLMGLQDDAFPGRFDKLIWTFLLIVMAPVGLWFFRSYRLMHWPEPKTESGSQPHRVRPLLSEETHRQRNVALFRIDRRCGALSRSFLVLGRTRPMATTDAEALLVRQVRAEMPRPGGN